MEQLEKRFAKKHRIPENMSQDVNNLRLGAIMNLDVISSQRKSGILFSLIMIFYTFSFAVDF
jgi:hypothetical protein